MAIVAAVALYVSRETLEVTMNYFDRLNAEKNELLQRISALSFFIHVSPKYESLSSKHKRLICLQYDFMKAYLLVLEMRIEDIKGGET